MPLKPSQERSSSLDELFSFIDPWLVVAAFIVPLLVSLPFIPNTFLSAGQVEYALGITCLGIVHFPGFPLYLICAKVVSLLAAFAPEPWQMNFASLFFSSLSCVQIYLTGRRLRFPVLVSFSATLTLNFSFYFWKASLLVLPYAFQVFLVTTCLAMTVDLLRTSRRLRQSFFAPLWWGGICGLAASQNLSLLPWILSAWLLGLVVGLPRIQALLGDYLLVFLGTGLGFILPYVYLPLRVVSGPAFWNPDFMYQYASLFTQPSWQKVFSWLAWYLSGGYHSFLTISSYAGLFPSLLEILRGYALLPLAIIGLGIFINFRLMLLHTAERSQVESHTPLRILFSLLPLIACSLEIIFLPNNQEALGLSLSLAATYWSFAGLEYCYYHLGQSPSLFQRAQLSKPSWFSIAVLLLMPLLALLQSYPGLALFRRASLAGSVIPQTEQLLQNLPAQTLLVSPRTEALYPFYYLQTRQRQRPDVQLAPFSAFWSDRTYTGPAFIPAFRSLAQLSEPRRIFQHYWKEDLERALYSNRPVFLLLSPVPGNELLDNLLQTYRVEKTSKTWRTWNAIAETNPLTASPAQASDYTLYNFRISAALQEVIPAEYPEKVLATFAQKIRLLEEPVKKILLLPSADALLNFSLQWQVLESLPRERFFLRIWIIPESAPKTLKPLFWESRRQLFPPDSAAPLKPQTRIITTYQLNLPAALPPGLYHLQIAVVDSSLNVLLPAQQPGQSPAYFVKAVAVKVVDNAVGTSSRPLP